MSTTKVVDISHYDNITSFEEMETAGVLGVIQKATEGASITDATYALRRPEVADTGLHWGAYHFLRPGDMQGQAHRFIDVANPTEATLLAVDYEVTGIALADLVSFISEVETLAKRPNGCLIYSDALLKEQLKKASAAQVSFFAARRLWLAQYAPAPKWPTKVWTDPWLWQFTETGTIQGATGKVDLNSFTGSDEDLASQWSGA